MSIGEKLDQINCTFTLRFCPKICSAGHSAVKAMVAYMAHEQPNTGSSEDTGKEGVLLEGTLIKGIKVKGDPGRIETKEEEVDQKAWAALVSVDVEDWYFQWVFHLRRRTRGWHVTNGFINILRRECPFTHQSIL